jgi:hypothetical protein
MPGGQGGVVDGEDEYEEEVSSDEQHAYDVLRTWQQVRAGGRAPACVAAELLPPVPTERPRPPRPAHPPLRRRVTHAAPAAARRPLQTREAGEGEGEGGKEGGGPPPEGATGADGQPFPGELPRRKRTRREREGAGGAAADSRLAAAVAEAQQAQLQQQYMALAQAGQLPLHLAGANFTDLLVPYVSGQPGMDDGARAPELMVRPPPMACVPPAAARPQLLPAAARAARFARSACCATSAPLVA